AIRWNASTTRSRACGHSARSSRSSCPGPRPRRRVGSRRLTAPTLVQGGSPMRTSVRSLVLAVCLWLAGAVAAHAVELQWWSHWAIEDSKKAVLFEVKRRFEAKNPGHTVTITFYEKKNMWPALRAAFTAGSGFPDVFYYDMDVPEFMATGWLADLSTGVHWENIEPYGKSFWTRPGAGGKTGTWAVPVEAASDEIYYNKKLFKELGIAVPAGYSFTQDQFKEVVAKCAKAGYA